MAHDDVTFDSNNVHILYGVLLPLFQLNNKTKDIEVKPRTYTMVFSNWMEISKLSEFEIFGVSDFYTYNTTDNAFR